MKALAILGSGLLAAATLATPGAADAQRYGHHYGYGHYRGHGYGYGRHYGYGYGYRHYRPYRYGYRYRGYGYRHGYGHYRGYYGHRRY